MKKKRLIILLSILVVVAVIGCFTFLYRAAKKEKDYLYEQCINNADKGAVNLCLNTSPEKTELGSDFKPGYTVYFLDYSITLCGYDNVTIDNDLNDDYISLYHVGDDDKLVSFEDISKFEDSKYLNDPIIEKAAGRKINNKYDLWEASLYCIPDDFTLLDADKNKGVSNLLDRKYSLMQLDCYQFDNGVVKGFILTVPPEGAIVYFSNSKVPDSFYQIVFVGFSMEEVKDILSTVTVGGSDSKKD